MGGMTRKQVIGLVVGIIVVIGIAVAVIAGNSPKQTDAGKDFVPTDTATIATQAPTTEPTVAPPVAQKETPSPTATVAAKNTGFPSAISPDFAVLDMGDPPALDKMAKPDEKAMRDKAYAAVPVFMNSAGPQYKTPSDARDELVSRGLITHHMADTQFFPEWVPYQQEVNAAQYTIQTTKMFCPLRGQSAGTVFDLKSMTCYYTREYVDTSGNAVSLQNYTESVKGGIGAIDPEQKARVVVGLAQEDGVWKIDSITNG